MRTATFFSGGGHVARRDAQGEALDHGRLADARLAGEDRVVLPAAGEDVDDLADLGVAAEHRVDLAGRARAVRSMVNWSSAFVRAGDARRSSAVAPVGASPSCCRIAVFHGARDDLAEVLPERLDGDRRELLGDLAREAGEFVLLEESEEDVPGADSGGAELDRADEPGLLDELREAGESAGVRGCRS